MSNKSKNNTYVINLSIKNVLEDHPDVSLRKLAAYAKLPYNQLLKLSKKPIVGEVYDPNKINAAAVDIYLAQHNIDLSKIDVEDITTAKRVATTTMQLKLNGRYKIRNVDEPVTIVALTKTHVCIAEAPTDDEEILRSMSITTFLHQSPKEVA